MVNAQGVTEQAHPLLVLNNLKEPSIVHLLDHLSVELEKRFTSHQKNVFQGLHLFPSLSVIEDSESVGGAVLKLVCVHVCVCALAHSAYLVHRHPDYVRCM